MRFSTIPTAAFVILQMGFPALANAGAEIDFYELLPIGGNSSAPYGKVITLEPFFGQVYYEAHPDMMDVSGTVDLELFTGVIQGQACTKGTKIASTKFSTSSSVLADASAYTPTKTKTNSVIGVSGFTIEDITTTDAYSGTAENGNVDLCVRCFTKANETYISHADYHMSLAVDFVAKFENFSQSVSINTTDTPDIDQNLTKTIDVEAFLCDRQNAANSYTVGQAFAICVRPTSKFINQGYSVSGFDDITCKNDGTTRQVYTNGTPDALTVSFDNVTSWKSTTGVQAGSSAKAFESVVVSGFFTSTTPTGPTQSPSSFTQSPTQTPTTPTSFTCSGTVSVKLEDQTSRHLTARLTASSEDLARGLQDVAPVLSSESTFAASVGLSNDGYDERLTASAGILTSGVVGDLFALVAMSLLALGEY